MQDKIPVTTSQKLLKYIKDNSKKGKPILLNFSALSEAWKVDSGCLKRASTSLVRRGFMSKCDDQGNKIKERQRAALAIVQLAIENGGWLPFSRWERIKLARKVGIKTSTYAKLFARNPFFYTEYNPDHSINRIVIKDMEEAAALVSQVPVVLKTRQGTNGYYIYVGGYDKLFKEKKVQEVKPLKVTTLHRAVAHLMSRGGEIWDGIAGIQYAADVEHCLASYAVKKLVKMGIIERDGKHIFIVNPERAALFLDPILNSNTEDAQILRQSLIYLPSGGFNVNEESVPIGTASNVEGDSTKNVTAVPNGVSNYCKLAKLNADIARKLVYYPRNYQNGSRILAMKYRESMMISEETEEERRRQLGKMWGKQRDIIVRLLNAMQVQFAIEGAITDDLVNQTAIKLRSALPSVDAPDNDICDRLLEFVENELPSQDACISWIESFIELAGCEFLSEFVFRDGFDFMLHILACANADTVKTSSKYIFQILLYIAYLGEYPYKPKFPEKFTTPSRMIFRNMKDCESLVTAIVLASALGEYMKLGLDLEMISDQSEWISDKLSAVYPFRKDGSVFWTSGFEQMSNNAEIALCDQFYMIEEWVDTYSSSKKEDTPLSRVSKYTAEWYELKWYEAMKYGLPGDSDLLRVKVAALRRWGQMSKEYQRTRLVPLLNVPERYSDPRLGWREWNEIASIKPKQNIADGYKAEEDMKYIVLTNDVETNEALLGGSCKPAEEVAALENEVEKTNTEAPEFYSENEEFFYETDND